MTAEQLILMLLQVILFTSVLTLGFKSTLSEPFFLFRHPRLFIRTFIAIYIVAPVLTAVILVLVPLPVDVKTGVILLAISPVATTLPHNMLILRANPPYVYSILISMSLIAVVMIPISLAILTALPLTHDASVPPFEVVKLIAQTVLLPLIIGAIIRRLAPRWTERLSQPINAISGKALIAALLALLALNLGGIAEAGLLSFIVLLFLTVSALAAGHFLGGSAVGDRAALAMAAAQRQTAIATLIAAINFPSPVTIDVIVIYLIINILAIKLYTKWCKKRLVAQTET
jgi:bile acid:Na+ symporter, BASS family